MQYANADVLAHDIERRIETGHEVGEELYRKLFGLLAEAISTRDYGVEAFELLEHDVKAAYVYGNASEWDEFDFGACWGAFSLLEACASYSERLLEDQERIEVVRRHEDLFRAMAKRPGITQKELANELCCGASNVSQILARYERYRLYLVSPEGKSKHCYLTAYGERALAEVRKCKPGFGQRDSEGQKTTASRLAADDVSPVPEGTNGTVTNHGRSIYVQSRGTNQLTFSNSMNTGVEAEPNDESIMQITNYNVAGSAKRRVA
ncbi:MAG: hypothetical protein IKG18_16630 [Atopobiaceae bacterium]|nr:hypothetical protein [Atopobiaceae bacterium]